MGEFPNKATQFQKGQSGNPKGRPKGTGITDRLRAILADDDGAVVGALAKVAIDAAKAGDFRFWKEIIDRIDGKCPDKVEADGATEVLVRYVDLSFDKPADGL